MSFDCWLSETKAIQAPDSECRESFVAALQGTEQAVMATWPENYVVLFEPGSDAVDAAGLNVATAASARRNCGPRSASA